MDNEAMKKYAIFAESAYLRNKSDKQKLVNQYYEGYNLLEKYTDKHHSVFEGPDSIILSVRGTDISDSFGQRNEDLIADAFVTLGLEKLTNRYKKSDKLLQKVMNENKDKKIILASHSLGSTVSRELGARYNLESHNYAPGHTFIHTKNHNIEQLFRRQKDLKDKTHIYITSSDPISTTSFSDMSANVHLVPLKKMSKKDKGVIHGHSLKNFYKD